jgi:copper chaperone CopZ
MRRAADAQARRVMESVEVSGLPAEVKPKGTHMITEIQTRTLEIGGMSGDACVKKVTSALKDVNGVETHSVKVGSANIKSDKAGCEAACAGIKHAGFTAHEATRTGNERNMASGDSKGDRRGDQQGNQPASQPVSHHGNEHGKGQSQPAVTQPGMSQPGMSQPGGLTDADKAGKPAGHEPSKAQTPATAPKPVMK